MRYLLFDEDAINKYASVSVMQSIEYATAQEFIKYICGDMPDGIFCDTKIKKADNGIIFCGRKEGSPTLENRKVFCIDLSTCNILKEKDHPGDLLIILQKSFRVCLKIWHYLPFSPSERYNESKSIIFPFVMPDSRRVVIERSSVVLGIERRGIDFPLLAYKYGKEDAPNGEEIVNSAVLKIAVREYSALYYEIQNELNTTHTSGEESQTDNALKCVSFETMKERGDFTYLNYQQKYDLLTDAQKSVVDHENLTNPLRIDGAAGTGKTASMIMRAYRLLMLHKEKGVPYRVVFFAHNESTCQRNKEMFSMHDGSEYFLDESSKQSILFITLLQYCVQMAPGLSIESLVDRDASDAKTYQLLLIETVVDRLEQQNKIRTVRSLLSSKLNELLDATKTDRSVLCTLLQHEFSVQIKGRTNGMIEDYYDLPPIANGLSIDERRDKEFVYLMFNEYQSELKSMASFDVDDAVMEASARLNAPIWRRERAISGFDYIFVDEMHLFNFNEQNIFHYLTKDITKKDIPICFACDYSQAIGDRGHIELDFINKAFGENVSRKNYGTVFRNSPQIVDFCQSIAASGTLMFDARFANPYNSGMKTQTNFTGEEEVKSEKPKLYLYANDEEMIVSLKDHISKLINDLHCKPNDIAIVSFDYSLASKTDVWKSLETTSFGFDRLCASMKTDSHKCLVATPYDINGLEFQAVILLGTDEGRVPQKTGVGDISQNFLKYSAFNMLYLAASRAKYRLLLLGNKLNGPSSCLEHSLSANYLDLETVD